MNVLFTGVVASLICSAAGDAGSFVIEHYSESTECDGRYNTATIPLGCISYADYYIAYLSVHYTPSEIDELTNNDYFTDQLPGYMNVVCESDRNRISLALYEDNKCTTLKELGDYDYDYGYTRDDAKTHQMSYSFGCEAEDYNYKRRRSILRDYDYDSEVSVHYSCTNADPSPSPTGGSTPSGGGGGSTPSGGGGGGGSYSKTESCKCSCCKGNNCNKALVASYDAGSSSACTSDSCRDDFPDVCPGSGESGSVSSSYSSSSSSNSGPPASGGNDNNPAALAGGIAATLIAGAMALL